MRAHSQTSNFCPEVEPIRTLLKPLSQKENREESTRNHFFPPLLFPLVKGNPVGHCATMSDFVCSDAGAFGRRVEGLLETMTITDVQDFSPEVAVISVASTEPHGPHLPYGTDTLIGAGVTAKAVQLANEKGARVLRLPPLPIGNNVNFKAFPFACRIRVETLMAVLADLAEFLSEDGIKKIVFVNSHGGNDSTIHASLRLIHDRLGDRIFTCAIRPDAFVGRECADIYSDDSPHAGKYETSMIQYLAGGLVVAEALQESPTTTPEIASLGGNSVHWVRPWHRLMPKSYSGRPDQASAEAGERCFNASAAGMAAFLVDLSRTPWHPGFPYPAK
jgi:creatinine amidohydrolase